MHQQLAVTHVRRFDDHAHQLRCGRDNRGTLTARTTAIKLVKEAVKLQRQNLAIPIDQVQAWSFSGDSQLMNDTRQTGPVSLIRTAGLVGQGKRCFGTTTSTSLHRARLSGVRAMEA